MYFLLSFNLFSNVLLLVSFLFFFSTLYPSFSVFLFLANFSLTFSVFYPVLPMPIMHIFEYTQSFLLFIYMSFSFARSRLPFFMNESFNYEYK